MFITSAIAFVNSFLVVIFVCVYGKIFVFQRDTGGKVFYTCVCVCVYTCELVTQPAMLSFDLSHTHERTNEEKFPNCIFTLLLCKCKINRNLYLNISAYIFCLPRFPRS